MFDVLRVFSKIRKEFVEEEAELSGMWVASGWWKYLTVSVLVENLATIELWWLRKSRLFYTDRYTEGTGLITVNQIWLHLTGFTHCA